MKPLKSRAKHIKNHCSWHSQVRIPGQHIRCQGIGILQIGELMDQPIDEITPEILVGKRSAEKAE